MVDTNEVRLLLFELGRAYRDALQAWPARVAPGLAAELGIDRTTLSHVLDREIRRHLTEIADTGALMRAGHGLAIIRVDHAPSPTARPLLPAMAERIALWPLDRLRPYDRNPRTHSDEQVAQIAASMAEFGFTNPILVDGESGIIAGHGRLAAARRLGLNEVPVVVLDHLTPAQRRAYVIADNRLALNAGWDEDLLAAELHALNGEGFDLALTGFSDTELEDLLAPLTEEGSEVATNEDDEETADAVPEVPADPICREGDLWQLGSHRLICGDAGNLEIIAALMEGEAASLCFTSPPYGQQRDYAGGLGDWDSLMRRVFAALPMAEDGQVLVNLGLVHREGEWQPYWQGWLDWMCGQGWRRFGLYCWDQGPGLPGDWNGRLAPAFELIFHFNRVARRPNKTVPCRWAGQDTHLRADGRSTGLRRKDGSVSAWSHAGQHTQDHRIPDSVFRVMRHKARGIEVEHPAVFPVALAEAVLMAYGDGGGLCFEPFGGAGTTLVAAERTGGRCRLVEIAPAYCDVILRRFRQLFPTLPVVRSDGLCFDDLTAQREAA